jgi:apolipoprotein N-acyltransferase
MLAWGWRRMLIAIAAGAATALALPGTLTIVGLPSVPLWPVPFFTFPVLVWLIDGSAAGRLGGVPAAAAAGWGFGFGYFVAGLYWLGNAVLVDAKTFGWLWPFAVVGLPACFALYTALGCGLARLIWTRGARRILALALALTISEWLRGHLFTGFPWNAFGYALVAPNNRFGLALAQTAALIGLWGVTFLAVAIYAAPAVIADEKGETKRRWVAPALAAAVVAALALYGSVRLHRNPTAMVDGVRLRIMQPDLQQDEKFNYSQKQAVMARYLALSDRASGPQSTGVANVTHLIWPESAFPFFLMREPDALAQIAALLPQGTVLITGAVRAPASLPPDARVTRAYNSIYVIDHAGSVLAVYDKVHLVPFGEYLPFQTVLERLGLMQLTKIRGGFIPGDRRRVLEVPGAPRMLPLICYEVIFPGDVVPRGERPGWMLNLTNDGWFGMSAGPYQHFEQARVRAIEEGLPLVRAANTGISAVVDPLGRVVKALPLGTEGVLDAMLPRPVARTLYARAGDSIAGLMVVAAFLLVVGGRRERTK